MFEIFNNIKELTLIFTEDGYLIFANETALFRFKSYMMSLVDTDISRFLPQEIIDDIYNNLKVNDKLVRDIEFTMGFSMKCDIKYIVDSCNDKYILIQDVGKETMENKIVENAIKVSTPKQLYDPLIIGKASMLSCEISIPATDILTSVSEIMNSDLIKKDKNLFNAAKSIEYNTKLLYQKSKKFIEEYANIEDKYTLTNSTFNLVEVIQNIVKRILDYLEIENINIDIGFSARTSEILISADYSKITTAFTALVAQSINLLLHLKKPGIINVKVIEEDGYAFVIIRDNSTGLDDKTIDRLLNSKTDISDMLGDSSGKKTLDIHMINTLIERNNGCLHIKNEKGKGTTAIIKFLSVEKRYLLKENISTLSINNLVMEEIEKWLK